MMNEKTIRSERKVLVASAAGNLVIGVVGILFAIFSHSQAILLDGLFNLTYFASGLFTLKVAKMVLRGNDERFPMGYAFFEPLINGIKGVLVLGLSIMALTGAVQALLAGGRTIAAAACWWLAAVMRRGAQRSGSPLALADAENWLVNGAISSAVLLAFVSILFIEKTFLAMTSAIKGEEDHSKGQRPVNSPIEQFEHVADSFEGYYKYFDDEITKFGAGGGPRSKFGSCAIVTMTRGKGMVFDAGASCWVDGIEGHDFFAEQITRNVLNKLSKEK